MNKKILVLVLAAVMLVAAVAAAGVVNGNREPSDLWVLCASGAAAAAEDFREYIRTGSETAWWSAVAEYRVFMQAYHLIQDDVSAEYTWCNSVYGFLLRGPDRAGDQAEELARAMELLAENPEDVNAFEIISRVNNELLHGT